MAPKLVKTRADVLQPAIVDGINRFCRDVLVQKGYLAQEHWEDESLLKLKHDVAQKVAASWEEAESNDET